jgi:hypothetical protein
MRSQAESLDLKYGKLLVDEHADLEKEKIRLKRALENVKTLRGLIPICSECKKVRNDEGYWQ